MVASKNYSSQAERATNSGSLGGIDALLGCPLYLPKHEVSLLFRFCSYLGSSWIGSSKVVIFFVRSISDVASCNFIFKSIRTLPSYDLDHYSCILFITLTSTLLLSWILIASTHLMQLLLGEQWVGLSRNCKEICCLSLFYAINWIRELVKPHVFEFGLLRPGLMLQFFFLNVSSSSLMLLYTADKCVLYPDSSTVR